MLYELFVKRITKETLTEEQHAFLRLLLESVKEGHLCYESSKAPDFPSSMIEENAPLFPKAPIIKDQNRYYLHHFWVLETHILNEVQRLRQTPLCRNNSENREFDKEIPLNFCSERVTLAPGQGAIENKISETKPTPSNTDASSCFSISLEKHALFLDALEKTTLLEQQKQAVRNSFEHSLSIIAGGPGTGKTHTAATLISLYLNLFPHAKVVVAAPTGKAASHLQSSLKESVTATTLHRLLNIKPKQPKLFSKFQVDADLVIVDEASMMDVYLLAKLLESIGRETRLVLMGDPDQLPPVEAGSLFRELSEKFAVFLQKPMRTDNSSLTRLATLINEGSLPEDLPLLEETFDSSFLETLYQKVDPCLSKNPIDPKEALQKILSFRVLSALRKGPFGVEAINQAIYQKMLTRVKEPLFFALPLLIRANAPDLDLYNGSFGVLVGQFKRGSFHLFDTTAYFPKPIAYRQLPSFEISFCLSIHQSQGSEFEKVLALFPEGSENFGKEALYTAITRAKKEIEIMANRKTLLAMLSQKNLKTSGIAHRFS